MTADLASVQELVDDVRSVMGSDTATLLLLDDTGTVLEPAASAGLGRRWRGATHVPVGSGFAGRVAAGRAPVVLDEVNELSVLNPILRDFGLRRLLGVPVLGGERLLGVLHAGWLSSRDLTSEDIARWSRLLPRSVDGSPRAPRTTLTWRRSPCSAACSRPRPRRSTASTSRCATCRPKAISEVTGTTSSRFPTARSGS